MANTNVTKNLKKERPNAEIIGGWKKKHGKLMKIEIPEDEMMIILREPGMKEIQHATLAARKPGALPFDFNASIVQDCKLYEDEGFGSDEKRIMTVYEHLDKFRVTKESVVEEL